MKMVIELSSIYEGDVEELQKLAEEIEELKQYTGDIQHGTVYKVLKEAERGKQQLFKKKLSSILEKLNGEDLLLCSTSREPEDDENQAFRW